MQRDDIILDTHVHLSCVSTDLFCISHDKNCEFKRPSFKNDKSVATAVHKPIVEPCIMESLSL